MLIFVSIPTAVLFPPKNVKPLSNIPSKDAKRGCRNHGPPKLDIIQPEQTFPVRLFTSDKIQILKVFFEISINFSHPKRSDFVRRTFSASCRTFPIKVLFL